MSGKTNSTQSIVKKQWLFVSYFMILAFLFNCCSVYYTTSEIDSQLKSSVESLNSNYRSITSEFNKMKTEYLKLGCTSDKDPFLTADQLISKMEADIRVIDKIKGEVDAEYGYFIRYTKGKTKISSGTVEWKKLKTTKKIFKTDLKELQKHGDALSKKGAEFNSFASEELMPVVRYSVVSDCVNKCRQGIEQIENNKMALANSINENEKKVKPITSRYSKSHPYQIGVIMKEFEKIRKELGSIDRIRTELAEITLSFEKKTRGKNKIYNCSQDWSLVEQVESDISRVQKNLKDVEARIRSGINSIQIVVNELSGQ